MKIVFFGTPDYVLSILTSLHKKFVTGPGKSPIVAVVTQSPKPVGRKQIITYSPIDHWAHEHGVPIHYSANELAIDGIDADVGVLASYGEIIKPEVIKLFPQGILVIHPSLLPKFRWGSPVPAAIITDSNPTGVTIIKMDDKFDHGPIVTQSKEEILPDDTTESLRARLFEKSAAVLVESIEPYLQGKIKPKVQNEEDASFARIFTKEEACIPNEYITSTLKEVALQGNWKIPFITDFSMPVTAENIDRFIRAMKPWPVAWTPVHLSTTDGSTKRLKILNAHVDGEKITLDEVQLEGKNPVSWKQFKEAFPNSDLKVN
jgi:methionyl-tRNA formyltransferase